MALTQTHYRFRTDANAVDATPTWGADEDASPSPATSPFRLRTGLYGTSAASGEFELYAQKNAGSYAAITTSATGGVQSYDASSDADDTALLVPRLTMSAAWWLAGAAIDLDFSGNQIYPSGAFTDYLSCSRASIGYAKNADGTLTQFSTDTLRIGVGTGLLSEDARTNILLYSQQLDYTGTDTVWENMGTTTVTPNTAVAPDGTTTADTVARSVNSAPSLRHGGVNFGLDWAAGTDYTMSVYVKVASGSGWIWIFISDSSYGHRFGAYFDCSGAGTVGNSEVQGTASLAAKSIEALANGWYRCVVTGQFSSIIENGYVNFATSCADNSSANWDGSGSMYLWGAQVEQASFASSYIPTTTTSAVRAADVITNIGNLQTDIAAAAGSIVAQVNDGNIGIAANIVDSNGTNLLGFDATNHGLASITAPLATANTANRTTQDKLGIGWDGSGRSLVLNGGAVASDASAQTPSSTQHLGSSGTDKFAFAYVERLTVWTSKLADATLQGFTA